MRIQRDKYLNDLIVRMGYAAEGAGPLPNHESRKPLSETVTYR